jgi:hypothetical protein
MRANVGKADTDRGPIEVDPLTPFIHLSRRLRAKRASFFDFHDR